MATVSDSSPLIALEQIGHLELLRDLFQEVLVPEEVVRETTAAVGLRPWLRRVPLQGPLLSQVLRPTLGQGEREAISFNAVHDCFGGLPVGGGRELRFRRGRHIALPCRWPPLLHPEAGLKPRAG